MTASNDALIHLMSRVSLGDRSAFETLYDETSPHVMGLLSSMLRRREVAEDVLQDTFVKVWHRAADYHPERGQVNTWIASIARYAAIDLLREGKHRQTQDDVLDTLPDDAASALEEIAGASEEDRLHYCIGTLSADQRQTITLAFFRGYTHEELASQLARPLGTVKAWVRRGLSKLRECLEQ